MRTVTTLLALLLGWLTLSSLVQAAGASTDGQVSAFLRGTYQDVGAVRSALEGQKFTILSSEKVDKKGELVTVIFTSPKLIKQASKPGRGFAAVLRILVNNAEKEISVTNPIYFAKAFLQKEYDDATAKASLAQINQAFPGLKESEERLAFDDLAGYHFMVGMPYYSDQINIGKGKNAELIQKAKTYKKGKYLLFEQKLDNGATLLGYTVGKRTAKFTKKIGTRNAAVLPYTILIEDNAAWILDPKYDLAIHYPTLTMSQFMTIATIPGAIEKDCGKAFK